jgi:putative transposase
METGGESMQTVTPLEPGGYFHIYDRGVNRGNIFYEERNYTYFLNLYAKHITPSAETFAYCLMRNHFHLLVRIRTRIKTDAVNKPASVLVSPALASKAFNNLLTAYAKAMNKSYGRTGALFQHHFGRIPITSGRYFAVLVRYIHRNPRKHGFVDDFREWPYSSYHTLAQTNAISETAAVLISRVTLLDWFGGAQGFRNLHSDDGDEQDLRAWMGDDPR